MGCDSLNSEKKSCEIPCGKGSCEKSLNWDDAINLRLEMLVTEKGQFHSRHFPDSEEDRDKLLALKGGGMGHVAHAFLIEALKREALLGYFSVQSKEGLDGKIYKILNQIILKELPKIIENLNIDGINRSSE